MLMDEGKLREFVASSSCFKRIATVISFDRREIISQGKLEHQEGRRSNRKIVFIRINITEKKKYPEPECFTGKF